MIYISCGLNQDFIIKLLEEKPIEGITFKYVSKSGIKLAFEVDTPKLEQAIEIAKATIKATEIGSIMYFQVSTN